MSKCRLSLLGHFVLSKLSFLPDINTHLLQCRIVSFSQFGTFNAEPPVSALQSLASKSTYLNCNILWDLGGRNQANEARERGGRMEVFNQHLPRNRMLCCSFLFMLSPLLSGRKEREAEILRGAWESMRTKRLFRRRDPL